MANRKQIYKCYLKNIDTPLYGISNGSGLFLLENGKIGKNNEFESPNNRLIYDSSYHYNSFVPVVEQATRNVPEEVRTVLEFKFKDFEAMLKAKEALEESMKNLAKLESNVKSTEPEIRKAKGFISDKEFIEIFKENLSDEFKYKLEHQTQKGLYGENGEWTTHFSYKQNGGFGVVFHRNIYIDKYIGPEQYDFVDREYDDTLYISGRNSAHYKSIIEKYHRELPFSSDVDVKIEEHLSIGDKNSLNYDMYYSLDFDKLSMTKDCAVSTARLISGLDKEEDMER